MIKDPTHTWQRETKTLLDHYWTNQPQKVSNVYVNHDGSSDHGLIAGTRNTKKVISKARIIKKRSFKKFCPEVFINSLRKKKWLNLYLSEVVEEATNIFTNNLTVVGVLKHKPNYLQITNAVNVISTMKIEKIHSSTL